MFERFSVCTIMFSECAMLRKPGTQNGVVCVLGDSGRIVTECTEMFLECTTLHKP